MEEISFTFIETDAVLKKVCASLQKHDWLAFDTEFVSEKRFKTLLCLIQIASPEGYYLVDPFEINDFSPFFDLLSDPGILKITHAGENDYRIFAQNFGVYPKNIFDTQVAAGFSNFGYPISYSKLVEKVLNAHIDKAYAATFWDARPLKHRQLQYALADVSHLYPLYKYLSGYIGSKNRLTWVFSELENWCDPSFYERNIYKEATSGTLIHGLRKHKQIFLLKLHKWRYAEAERLDISREMAFPAKYITPIVKSIDQGKSVLKDSRVIPDKFIDTFWSTFEAILKEPATEEELEVLKNLPLNVKDDLLHESSMELLHALIKYKCIENDIAPTFVLVKSELTNSDKPVWFRDENVSDWRHELLGETLIQWMRDIPILNIDITDSSVVLTSAEK